MKLFFEKYIKLAHIGKGANAHVYKVRHAELEYVRAIKVLNDYIERKSERTYQSFLKECKTLLAIGNGAHPNIVRIYGPNLIENKAIVEMDYVQGITLDSYIKRKRFLDYEEIKSFIHDIVGALAYTHYDIYKCLMDPEKDDLQPDPNDGQKFLISSEKEAALVKKYGIAHNDLHSNNIMRRDYDGRFVLLDFGLAVQDGKCIKSSRVGDGNPEYQAPEKFDSETVDPRSDVYSLGILMYEMLAGRVPFELEYAEDGKVSRRAINDVLNKHLKSSPPPILPFRMEAFEASIPGAVYQRDYPEWLDGVIMKCLAKKPEDRFKNAKELIDNINAYLTEDSSYNREIRELKEKLDELDDKFKYQVNRNSQLYEEWQDTRHENEKLTKQLEASQMDAEKIPGLTNDIANLTEQWLYEKGEKERLISELNVHNKKLQDTRHQNEILSYQLKESQLDVEKISVMKDNITKLTEQWLYEKGEKERLISELGIHDDGFNVQDNNTWKIIGSPIIFIVLFLLVTGIWLYKDSQVTSVSRNLTNTILYAESKGVDGTEIYDMLDSLRSANIELGEFAPQISYTKQTIDSLQKVIVKLKKNNSSRNSSSEIARLKQDINSLNQQISTLKNQAASKSPKVDPGVQQELNKLRDENKKLKGQVERFLKTLSN